MAQLPYCPQRLLVVASLLASLPATALEYHAHGFAAQGYALTDNYDLLDNSSRGSLSLQEIGIGGSVSVRPDLFFAGQLLIRDFGSADNNELRIDFALMDYLAYTSDRASFGVRLGRTRNPYGFYNDTRDVAFSRPGILMPQAVYYEGQGFRDLLFSSDGGQLYGSLRRGSVLTQLIIGAGVESNPDEKVQRNLSGGLTFPGKLEFKDYRMAHWSIDWAGGIFRTSVSYVREGLLFTKPDGGKLADFDFDIWALSAQYSARRTTITFEYGLLDTKGEESAGLGIGRIDSVADGAYLQLSRYIGTRWTAYTRYDARAADRKDRHGRSYQQRTGEPRHTQFARHSVVGLRWQPWTSLGLWAEFHYVDGTQTVPAIENPGPRDDRYWNALLLMVAYQFHR